MRLPFRLGTCQGLFRKIFQPWCRLPAQHQELPGAHGEYNLHSGTDCPPNSSLGFLADTTNCATPQPAIGKKASFCDAAWATATIASCSSKSIACSSLQVQTKDDPETSHRWEATPASGFPNICNCPTPQQDRKKIQMDRQRPNERRMISPRRLPSGSGQAGRFARQKFRSFLLLERRLISFSAVPCTKAISAAICELNTVMSAR